VVWASGKCVGRVNFPIHWYPVLRFALKPSSVARVAQSRELSAAACLAGYVLWQLQLHRAAKVYDRKRLTGSYSLNAFGDSACVAWLGYQNRCKILILMPLLPARYPPTMVAQCLLHNDCMVSMPLSDEAPSRFSASACKLWPHSCFALFTP
jgi:hypothetical protein